MADPFTLAVIMAGVLVAPDTASAWKTGTNPANERQAARYAERVRREGLPKRELTGYQKVLANAAERAAAKSDAKQQAKLDRINDQAPAAYRRKLDRRDAFRGKTKSWISDGADWIKITARGGMADAIRDVRAKRAADRERAQVQKIHADEDAAWDENKDRPALPDPPELDVPPPWNGPDEDDEDAAWRENDRRDRVADTDTSTTAEPDAGPPASVTDIRTKRQQPEREVVFGSSRKAPPEPPPVPESGPGAPHPQESTKPASEPEPESAGKGDDTERDPGVPKPKPVVVSPDTAERRANETQGQYREIWPDSRVDTTWRDWHEGLITTDERDAELADQSVGAELANRYQLTATEMSDLAEGDFNDRADDALEARFGDRVAADNAGASEEPADQVGEDEAQPPQESHRQVDTDEDGAVHVTNTAHGAVVGVQAGVINGSSVFMSAKPVPTDDESVTTSTATVDSDGRTTHVTNTAHGAVHGIQTGVFNGNLTQTPGGTFVNGKPINSNNGGSSMTDDTTNAAPVTGAEQTGEVDSIDQAIDLLSKESRYSGELASYIEGLVGDADKALGDIRNTELPKLESTRGFLTGWGYKQGGAVIAPLDHAAEKFEGAQAKLAAASAAFTEAMEELTGAADDFLSSKNSIGSQKDIQERMQSAAAQEGAAKREFYLNG